MSEYQFLALLAYGAVDPIVGIQASLFLCWYFYGFSLQFARSHFRFWVQLLSIVGSIRMQVHLFYLELLNGRILILPYKIWLISLVDLLFLLGLEWGTYMGKQLWVAYPSKLKISSVITLNHAVLYLFLVPILPLRLQPLFILSNAA